MSSRATSRAAVIERQHDGVRSGRLGLGRGQCRLRQDPRAGAARDPAAARGRRSGEDPLPHLHQGRRRQHGEPRVRTLCGRGRALDDAALDDAMREGRREPHRRRAARARAAAVRAGAGDAGRPEGADHPRLLHAAAAPVSVRGQCRGALRGARRDRAKTSCSNSSASTCCSKAAGEPDSAARPRAGPGRARRRRRDLPRPGRARRSASATS